MHPDDKSFASRRGFFIFSVCPQRITVSFSLGEKRLALSVIRTFNLKSPRTDVLKLTRSLPSATPPSCNNASLARIVTYLVLKAFY